MHSALPTRPRDTLTSPVARHAAETPAPALVIEAEPGVVEAAAVGGRIATSTVPDPVDVGADLRRTFVGKNRKHLIRTAETSGGTP